MESTFYSILERHEDGRNQWLQHTQTSAISEHANMYGFYPLWDEVTFIDRHKVVYFKTIFHFQVMFGLNRDKNNQLFYFYFAMGLPYILYCLHNDRNKIVYFKTVFLFPVLCDAKIELK